jgi:hypothetical protein
MKNNLREQLERIHRLNYGNKVIKEGFLDFLMGKKDKDSEQKIDDPKKADLVSSDVNDFFLSLQKAADGDGLSQQQRGSITYQKEVESMQIGLMLLGYDLPVHGVDGLFGPETAAAVSKFTAEKVSGNKAPVNEAVALVSQGGGIIGRPGQGTHNADDWPSGNAWDITGPVGTQVFSITNGVVQKVKRAGNGIVRSGVKVIFGDQVSVKSNDGKPDVFYTHIDSTVNQGDAVKEGDVIGTIIQMGGIPSHVHVGLSTGNLSDLASGLDNAGGGSASFQMTKATPEMLKTLIELLKQRGVKSEELKHYIDSVKTGGGAAFTDLDLMTPEGMTAYDAICQRFIDIKKPNPLGITGEMMARGAKMAFERYQRFVPAELALAQLAAEGGIANGNMDSRPIRTRNPFNVGNTDDGSNISHNDVQSGINAYYLLIAKDYIGKGKTANDLITNFVNKNDQRYAGSTTYENVVSTLAGQANRLAQPVVASISKPNGSETV